MHHSVYPPVLKLLSLLLFFSLTLPAQAKSTNIYYFFPDSPVGNFSQLKIRMEKMFAKSHFDVTFQPFVRLSDLEQKMKANPPELLISPDWFISHQKNLKAVLRAYRNKKPTYIKYLIANISMDSNRLAFQGKTLAVTRMSIEQKSIDDLFSKKLSIQFINLNTVEVVKDVDAIFAVALKQVDMALVAQSSMLKIAKINARIVKSINIITETIPLSMPGVVRLDHKNPKQEISALITFMTSLKNDNDNAFKTLLQIDEWREVQ